MLGRKPCVRCPPVSSDMPSKRWLPSLARRVSQSASERSLTCLAPSSASPGASTLVARMAQIGHEVGVDARVRLDVGIGCAEQLTCVLGGNRLDRVDVLAGRIEPVPHRALGVLVGQPRAHREQHRRRRVVLAGYQLQRSPLVRKLFAGRLGDARLDRLDDPQHRAVCLTGRVGVFGARRGGGAGHAGVRSHGLERNPRADSPWDRPHASAPAGLTRHRHEAPTGSAPRRVTAQTVR